MKYGFLAFSVLWTVLVGVMLVRALLSGAHRGWRAVPGVVQPGTIPGKERDALVRFRDDAGHERQFAMRAPSGLLPGTEVTVRHDPSDSYRAVVEGAPKQLAGVLVLIGMVAFGLLFCFIGSVIAFGSWFVF